MKIRLMEPWEGRASGAVVELPRSEALALIGERAAVDLGNADVREPTRIRNEQHTQETDR